MNVGQLILNALGLRNDTRVPYPARHDHRAEPHLVPIGRDIEAGWTNYWDMRRQPHALIAGTSNGGKTILQYAILRHWVDSGAFARIAVCDPKMVDFLAAKHLPGVGLYVTLPEIAAAVRGFRNASDQRYERTFAAGRRNYIDEIILNEGRLGLLVDEIQDVTLKEAGLTKGSEDWEINQLRQQISTDLRLAGSKGRASGAHLALATQHPSVDVVTTGIKAVTEFRCYFRTDETAANMVLHAPAAASLPDIPGRALVGPRGILRETQVFLTEPDEFDTWAASR